MRSLNKFVVTYASILCLFHLINLVYIAFAVEAERSAGMFSLEGSLNTQLSFIHLGVSFLLILFVIFSKDDGVFGRLVPLIAIIGICTIYGWWYLEKYSFLEVGYGLKKGSDAYQTWLSEIGAFRGGGQWDRIAFFMTVLLIPYAFLRIRASQMSEKYFSEVD